MKIHEPGAPLETESRKKISFDKIKQTAAFGETKVGGTGAETGNCFAER